MTRAPIAVVLCAVLTPVACAQSSEAAKPALTADSMQHADVPAGTLSATKTYRSRIYDGMVTNYRVYAPAQYDGRTPAALMVFQDGLGYAHRDGDHPALNVLDNLIAQHKIPVMIAVFVDPGDISGAVGSATFRFVEAQSQRSHRSLQDVMRSVEYDTVSDRYARFLRDELMPEIAKTYTVRTDAYSRAITGLSSGGICAFNAAWQMPDQFSRVVSWIGSFTSIQWREDPAVPDGGQDFPEKVLHEDRRNLRVWLEDGADDMENPRFGSWPLANIRMANALNLKGYDLRFSFGTGPHSPAHGGAEFPQEMIWLWRGYDPARTAETYVQDPAEAKQPPFRVTITNRTP